MRRGILGGAVVTLVALVLSAPLQASPSGGARRDESCGPADAATVFEGAGARLYLVNADRFFYPKEFSVGNDSQRLYGCLLGGGRSWRVDRRFEDFFFARFRSKTIKVRSPWVAAAQQTLTGIDTGRVDVLAVNLRDGTSYVCPVSESLEGNVKSMVLAAGGRVGWIAEMSFYNPTEQRFVPLPVVAVCGSAGTRIIEADAGIDRRSLRLNGRTLEWVSGGERKSYPP